MSKLIIIRGNSGSGKSTIAKMVREEISEKTALVEQDYLRRHVLGEIGKSGDDNVELINKVARFALDNDYITIVEGIMPSEYFGEMLSSLVAFAKEAHVFYLDVTLEETLRRHQTKPNRDEFDETEMRDWYREKDVLGVPNECIIKTDATLEESVERVLSCI